jgi:anhydro-N-acetylmuramic acid kinase
MEMLASRTNAEVVTAEAVGLSVDFMEAQAFAYLAVRRIRGLPSSFPGTTGVAIPVVAGDMARAEH